MPSLRRTRGAARRRRTPCSTSTECDVLFSGSPHARTTTRILLLIYMSARPRTGPDDERKPRRRRSAVRTSQRKNKMSGRVKGFFFWGESQHHQRAGSEKIAFWIRGGTFFFFFGMKNEIGSMRRSASRTSSLITLFLHALKKRSVFLTRGVFRKECVVVNS